MKDLKHMIMASIGAVLGVFALCSTTLAASYTPSPARPNLSVRLLSFAPDIREAGEKIFPTIEVFNGGSAASPALSIRLRIDLNEKHVQYIELPLVSTDALAPGMSRIVPLGEWTAVAGLHGFEACVIPGSADGAQPKCTTYAITFNVRSQNRQGRIDFAVMSNGYTDFAAFRQDAKKYTDFLLTLEPFRSRAADLHFATIENSRDLHCVVSSVEFGGPRIDCDNNAAAEVAVQAGVPFDRIGIIDNVPLGGGGGVVVAASSNGSEGNITFAHEFGHTFGLDDEYLQSATPGLSDNGCQHQCCRTLSACQAAWKDIPGAGCFLGCSFPNWYRPSEQSIMRSHDAPVFSAVSQRLISNTFEYFLEKTPPSGSLQLLRAGGSYRPTASVQIQGADDHAVHWLDVAIDGVPSYSRQVPMWDAKVGNETFYWNIQDLPEGSLHGLRLTVTDLAGNEFTAPLVQVVIGRASLRIMGTGTAMGPVVIREGDLIRAKGDADVYIVKFMGEKKFKRLILSPSVFKSYRHLSWDAILDVTPETLAAFKTSELVRSVGDDRVYRLYPKGDQGERRWIANASVFARSGFEADAIYEINAFDRDSYAQGADVE